MCGEPMCPGRPPVAPEKRLADLIFKELGIEIDRSALRMFIRAHWANVSVYAHKIHRDELAD